MAHDSVWLIEAGELRWFTEDESRTHHWLAIKGAKVTRYVKDEDSAARGCLGSMDASSSEAQASVRMDTGELQGGAMAGAATGATVVQDTGEPQIVRIA